MNPQQLNAFVLNFMLEVDKEISEIKICINARAREIAESFLKQVKSSIFLILVVPALWQKCIIKKEIGKNAAPCA